MAGKSVSNYKILIGTLYSLENELTECRASIERQTYKDYEHFILRGLPDKDAHDKLYKTFMDQADQFDLFLKLDADMVIENENLLQQVADKFKKNPNMHILTIPVHDYFTDSLIIGMHTYRNTVKWPERINDVFTDDHIVPKDKVILDFNELAPAAIHCKNPSPFQSFHFGLHRGVKLKVALKDYKKRHAHLKTHINQIELIWINFLRTDDIRIGFAALGAELALRGDFKSEHINYSNPFAENVFLEDYANMGYYQIKRIVRILRINNRINQPSILLRYLYWYKICTLINYFSDVFKKNFVPKFI